MYTACTYEEIEKQEKEIKNREVVVFLFARPTEREILKEFAYLHYNSAKTCSIYAVGYTDDLSNKASLHFRKVETNMDTDWYYSDKVFVEFKNALESRIKWKYSGEDEILILQNNPGNRNSLNFQNYVSININEGLRAGYIDSFQMLMESLIRCAKSTETAKEVINNVRKEKFSIREMLSSAIEDCKKVPSPVKDIIKNHLFYRSANSIH